MGVTYLKGSRFLIRLETGLTWGFSFGVSPTEGPSRFFSPPIFSFPGGNRGLVFTPGGWSPPLCGGTLSVSVGPLSPYIPGAPFGPGGPISFGGASPSQILTTPPVFKSSANGFGSRAGGNISTHLGRGGIRAPLETNLWRPR